MLKWLSQLMAGDQSSVPEDAEVERDALGRVIRVTQTLGARRPEKGHTNHPKLAVTASSRPVLTQASQWLREQNIRAACTWGYGLETRFAFNQGDGLLRLTFEDRTELALPAQLLGSFDPSDRSFMWGWHNPSFKPELQRAARAAREAGDQLGEAAFSVPVQTVTFDSLLPLLAFAAQAAGCDGVYRAYLDPGTTVFLGFNDKDVARVLDPIDPDFGAKARTRVEAYDRDQMRQDRIYNEQKDSGDADLLKRVVEAKLESWLRDWSREGEDWHPCSTTWPSNHDRALSPVQFMAPHPLGGVLDCRVGPSVKKRIYRLGSVDGEAKITDQLIYWGEGFIWPYAG